MAIDIVFAPLQTQSSDAAVSTTPIWRGGEPGVVGEAGGSASGASLGAREPQSFSVEVEEHGEQSGGFVALHEGITTVKLPGIVRALLARDEHGPPKFSPKSVVTSALVVAILPRWMRSAA